MAETTARRKILRRLTPQIETRFWGMVDRQGPEDCWPWRAACDGGGYGRFKVSQDLTAKAHRVAFASHFRCEPAPLLVMHRCDNPPCCNPAHFMLGTNTCNQADSAAKGRHVCFRLHAPCERNMAAKLTDVEAVSIFEAIYAGRTNTDIADLFGVTHSLVSAMRRGKAWRELHWLVWDPKHPALRPYASLSR